jgi:PilZ domain
MVVKNASATAESIAPLIAWLSTCLLAGGLGALANPDVHTLWLRTGCFGLVAAVGLEGAARVRARGRSAKHRLALQRRWDRSLQMIVAERDSAAELRAAITRLLPAMPSLARENDPSCEEPRWSCDLDVEVFPVRRDSTSTYTATNDEMVAGRLGNLSNSGFGLELEQAIARPLVIISVLPPHEQEFDLLGEVLWCEPRPDGKLVAGGRLLRVLPRSAAQPAVYLPLAIEEPLPEAVG